MIKGTGLVCITGGAGFIGSRLAHALLERGRSVRVLDDLSVGRAEAVPAGAELLVGDILDPVAVAAAMAGVDTVFHLAARVAIRSSFDFTVRDAQVNFCGTASVLDAARRAGTVRKLVFTSSMAVYEDAAAPTPIPETYPTRPVSPYGISKLGAEALVHSLCAEAGMDSVALRLFNTYGPGQALSPYVGVVTIFVDKLRRGERPTVFGDGEQARDFIHVQDVVAGLICAQDTVLTGETINLGAGQAVTVNEVLRQLNRVLGTDAEPFHSAAVAGELRNSVADIEKARRLLGFEPTHAFADAIATVVAQMPVSEMPRSGPG